MQVILTAFDLAAMPTALRRDLLAYLATRRKRPPSGSRPRPTAAESGVFDDLAVLSHDQAVALVRNVSFGRELKGLHDLLAAFAYEKDAGAPRPEALVRLLKLENPRHLRRYLTAVKRVLKQVTGDIAPITRYSRRTGAHLVHPITRARSREVFAQLAQSGEGEEPPWA